MKRLILLLAVVPLCAQTPQPTKDGGRVFLGVSDASGATQTKPMRAVTGTLPATCATGEIVQKTDAAADQQIHVCTSPNTWTVQTTKTYVDTAVGTKADAAATTSALAGKQDVSAKGQPGGYVGIDANGNVPIGTTVICSTIGTNTGTTYTLIAANNGCIARFTAASDITLTLNTDVAVAGYSVLIVQRGLGSVVPTAGAGVTIRQRQSYTKTAGQYALASLVCDVANDCVLSGDLQ